MSDEIITELYAIKDAIGASVNYDLHTLFRDINRCEIELQAAGVILITPPIKSTNIPDSALQRTRFVRR